MHFVKDIKNLYNININKIFNNKDYTLVNIFKNKDDADSLAESYRKNKNSYRIVPVFLKEIPDEKIREKCGYKLENYKHWAFYRMLR